MNEMLDRYNIKHKYISPRKPSSNGGVERCNRTLQQSLRVPNTAEISKNWDKEINNVVMNYNNTWHSEIKMSPCQFILEKQHEATNQLPIRSEIIDNWKIGHPNYCPFKLNQKVLKKIHPSGNLVNNKFKPKYEGPLIVTKVNENRVTYEVSNGKKNSESSS